MRYLIDYGCAAYEVTNQSAPSDTRLTVVYVPLATPSAELGAQIVTEAVPRSGQIGETELGVVIVFVYGEAVVHRIVRVCPSETALGMINPVAGGAIINCGPRWPLSV